MTPDLKKNILALIIAIVSLVIVLALLSALSSRQALLKEFTEKAKDAEAALIEQAKEVAGFIRDPRVTPEESDAEEATALSQIQAFSGLYRDLYVAEDWVWGIKSEIAHGYDDDYAIRETSWMNRFVLRSLPSEITLCIALMFCGVLGATLSRLSRNQCEMLTSIPLGMGAGLIIFLAMKGSTVIFFLDGFSENAQFNQYSFVLLALLSGMYSDQFFEALSSAYSKIFKTSQ